MKTFDEPRTSKYHLHTIDLLRGVAALIVCIGHYTSLLLPSIHRQELQSLFWWSWVGVEIFFVISGFVIPFVLFHSGYTISRFLPFMANRFLRICLPSYIIIVLTILQWRLLGTTLDPGAYTSQQISGGRLVHNLLYTVPFTSFTWMNGVFWTLAIEFQFYFLIAIAYPFMFRSRITFVLYSILMLALFYIPVSRYVGLFQYGSFFLMGSLTQLYYTRRISFYQFALSLICVATVCFLQKGLVAAAFGIGTSFAIAFFSIRNAVTNFLGRISYSLYLSHVLVASTAEVVLAKFYHPRGLIWTVLTLIACLGLALLFSWLFYRTVELYFIKMAARLFKYKGKTGPPPEAKEVAL